ncbi:hypothetical protein SLV14_006707 [Streptomyces sp. Je 1-4]|uniref:hypothetical protein n=1 Tax=Streptomyces TaxID=1883 RepID=UPI00140F25CD|nr:MULTISPECIES: hypothetical protein [unclassified Streptomyces]QIK09950.1 hypothetical protein G7Z12_31725 [Streptomyces sp. ID38640]UYB43697.1 hypothetical protein SLV14_006707 [Streptomyces sp. Je 1-4]UZQ40101.1 hypothetical protein SLV14N_006707 [Streptomyces sp. Je 1-4] [Streptomyces sp. Je 1-4 4N24]UZQ47518.1 hypothetical protein SLV14NA_006707 [Streptomyces sp. Je 1-4] [Streptomyces sp. Je 1-4 4N24_ara]
MSLGTTDKAAGGRLSQFLDSPVIGMSPWIAMSVIVGPGRFELAVAIALALAVALVIVGRIRRPGSSFKILEIADVVFFAVMAIIGILASPGAYRWLENYAGEVANIALMAIALGSMACRVPFTLQYAREQVPREYWNEPRFLRTNYYITGAWGAAFAVAAIAGAYGDLVLRNSNNLWTGWIIQIGAIIAALQFTEWYPDVVRARSLRERNLRGPPEPPVSDFLIPLAGYLTPVGILVLAFGAGPVWLGVVLIVLGVVLAKSLSRTEEAEPDASG